MNKSPLKFLKVSDSVDHGFRVLLIVSVQCYCILHGNVLDLLTKSKAGPKRRTHVKNFSPFVERVSKH